MPDIEISDPITIPAKAAIVCNKMLAPSIVITRDSDGIWHAIATLNFYGTDEAGNVVYARNGDGSLVEDRVGSDDVLRDAQETPELAGAFVAMQTAIAVLWAKRTTAPAEDAPQ